MSGSNGPSGGDGGSDDPCSALRLVRRLDAPVPGVAEALRVGDLLVLELHAGPPETVALLTSTEVLAGSVVPTIRLLQCLHDGVAFVAEVRSASDGIVELEVRARS